MKHILLVSFAAAQFALQAMVMDGIAARVDSDAITIGEVLSEIRRNPDMREAFSVAARDPDQVKKLYRDAVNHLIDRRLILHAAAQKKIEMQEWVVDNRVREVVKDSFKGDRTALEAELQKSNMPFTEWRNTIRDDLIVGAMRYQLIEKFIQPTPAEMAREFADHPMRYADEASTTVSVILLKPGEKDQPSVAERGRKILAALAAPNADFAELARTHSSDSHAKDGGVWRDVQPEEAFRPEIAAAISKLAVGAHSELIDLDGWGFIVRKDSEKAAKKRTFAEAYDHIRRHLRREASEKATEAWLKRLRAEAFIQINPMPEK